MLVACLVDPCGVHLDPAHVAVDQPARLIANFRAAARDDGAVAFLEVGDLIGERCECDRIRAQVHLALTMADGQRRAFARGHDQVFFTVEQEGEREGAIELVHRGQCRGHRVHAVLHVLVCQKGDRLCVGFRLKCQARGG